MPALGAAKSVPRRLPLLALPRRRAPAVRGCATRGLRPVVRAPAGVRVRRRTVRVHLRCVELRRVPGGRMPRVLRRRGGRPRCGDLRRVRRPRTARRPRRGSARRSRVRRELPDGNGSPSRGERVHLRRPCRVQRPPAGDRRSVHLPRTRDRGSCTRHRDARLARMQQHEREGDSRKEGGHGDDDSGLPGNAGHCAAADQKLLFSRSFTIRHPRPPSCRCHFAL